MTNKELAQKLLDLLGGKDNVLANAACMTRLRVTVKDAGNVDTEGIKALDGVMGLVEDDTMQVVLGPGKVNKVLEEFSKLTGLAKGVADESVVDAAATNKAAQKAKYESKPVQAFLKKIFQCLRRPASRHHCGWPHQRYLQRHQRLDGRRACRRVVVPGHSFHGLGPVCLSAHLGGL